MHNNSEDDYKVAVKSKYEEIKNGEYSIYLISPTRAKLSKLCWELFEGKNMHQNDKNIFNAFLGLAFDINKKREFRDKRNKFRPIETFFKGETNPQEIDKVDMAAILVNYQPRPFTKYRITDLTKDFKESEESVDSEFDNTKTEEVELVVSNNEEVTAEEATLPINLFINSEKQPKKDYKKIALVIITILGVIGFALVIKVIFLQKQCMQWSEDHYEKVDCKPEISGIGSFDKIVGFDEIEFLRKKIAVCDTTTCFSKDGEPILWYSKNDNKVDFFNMFGINPENKKTLRPITDYIFRKYKGDCKTKKSGSAN